MDIYKIDPSADSNEKEFRKKRKTTPEEYIHNKADSHARKSDERKENQTNSGFTHSELSASATVDDWADWTKQAESDDLITTSNGNDMSWESKWKKDPNDSSKQGLNTQLTMRPYNKGWDPWRNNYCKIDFDYNGSTFAEIPDYGPGNTIGSNTQAFSLAFSSDQILEVGVSSSVTSSNLDINNKSDVDANNVHHNFNIDGGIEKNTVRVNQSAITAGTDSSEPVTYCNQTLKAEFYAAIGYELPDKNIKVQWT